MSTPTSVRVAASERLVRECGSATKNAKPIPTANMATTKRPDRSTCPYLAGALDQKNTAGLWSASHGERSFHVVPVLADRPGIARAFRLPPRPTSGGGGGDAQARARGGDPRSFRASSGGRAGWFPGR